MKTRILSLLLAALLSAPALQADTVVEEVPDNLPGKSFGGLSGFMAGVVAGGPVGGAIGAGFGWLAGGTLQAATGLSGRAYRVTGDDGRVFTVRSPNRSRLSGERVRVVSGRLRTARDDGGATRTVSAPMD